MRLRSWLEQNADSGGSMNAKSHITTFKWRHINAFPVHLSSNNSLEQCAVHAHEIVFFSREAWTVLPWRAFWIGVLIQRFKTLILPSQNKHERSLSKPNMWLVHAYLPQTAQIYQQRKLTSMLLSGEYIFICIIKTLLKNIQLSNTLNLSMFIKGT